MSKNGSENKIKIQLDALALDIATEARKSNTIFVDKLDAFKALTAYHLGITKIKKKNGEDGKNSQGETFDAFRKSVEESG